MPGMEFIHRVERVTEATWRDGHVNEVRKIFLDSLRARSVFVASHY